MQCQPLSLTLTSSSYFTLLLGMQSYWIISTLWMYGVQWSTGFKWDSTHL